MYLDIQLKCQSRRIEDRRVRACAGKPVVRLAVGVCVVPVRRAIVRRVKDFGRAGSRRRCGRIMIFVVIMMIVFRAVRMQALGPRHRRVRSGAVGPGDVHRDQDRVCRDQKKT